MPILHVVGPKQTPPIRKRSSAFRIHIYSEIYVFKFKRCTHIKNQPDTTSKAEPIHVTTHKEKFAAYQLEKLQHYARNNLEETKQDGPTSKILERFF